MGQTLVDARARDGRHTGDAVRRRSPSDYLLLVTTVLSVLVIGSAYVARGRRLAVPERTPTVSVVNFKLIPDAAALEPALEAVLPNAADRRFAGRALFRYITTRRDAGDELTSVAAVTSVTVPVVTIEESAGLVTYRERLEAAKANADRAGRAPPAVLRVLTPGNAAAVRTAFVVRTPERFKRQAVVWALLCVLGVHGVALLWRLRGLRGDRLLLAAAHLLTAIGFAMLLARVDPLRDQLLFIRYATGVIIGLVIMGAVSLTDFRRPAFLRLGYIPLLLALGLSAVLLVFGDGPGTSDARVNLGPVQPIEAIRLLLALFLAGYFARRWELLRQLKTRTLRGDRLPSWIDVPRAEDVVPVGVAIAAALAFFFLQKDLGPALFLCCVFLALYGVARGRVPLVIAGLVLLAAGFYAGHRLEVSATLAERVQMWRSPWDNAVRGGDQVAQAVWALATGGTFGTGLGLGDTHYLPAGHTDLVLAALGEELGFGGILVIALVYGALVWRGFRIALSASTDYGFFLAAAVTLFLAIPVLVMTAGSVGVVPLTGVVTPFLSYGGSAMTANFAALGILVSIDRHRGPRERAAPFRRPVAWLGGTLAAAGVCLLGVLLAVQVVGADEYIVKPHLGVQADGVARYQYNPRVMEVVRSMSRGSVFDREGLALATGDATIAREALTRYRDLGVAANATCVDPIERCYPLGGAAFHLLGEVGTRANWGAGNTSYVERDAEDRLLGFDDRATAVPATDTGGRPFTRTRRDYRALVPLVRHRFEPDHPEVRDVRARDKDVRLTVDARLQLRVAAILSRHAARSTTGRAAAVVLNPDTGEVLALASYPWPAIDGLDRKHSAPASDAWLDRARYGLYPPGSTFKLVTATAALRRDPAMSHQRFTCSGLPDGRVGARIPGHRTVRDDVLDKHPHGAIGMHDGLVHSCNAYFAQLAWKLGPEALLDVAARLGISVASAGSADRLRASLPQAGYGQGEVVVTPLRMARVAAALASDGVLRDVRWEASAEGKNQTLVSPEAARTLAGYMRDSVLAGTGRSLRGHPGRIAGKTGTAEVGGAPSHSWFIGFAPHGPATQKIAFAVIVENAGYGGQAAAPVAGEIVSAALSLGLVK